MIHAVKAPEEREYRTTLHARSQLKRMYRSSSRSAECLLVWEQAERLDWFKSPTQGRRMGRSRTPG